ncbi:MAG: hypothetical protein LUQ30_05400 [Methanothrix sp.]|nr:hypothetical protein [Methanothrix sp.]
MARPPASPAQSRKKPLTLHDRAVRSGEELTMIKQRSRERTLWPERFSDDDIAL